MCRRASDSPLQPPLASGCGGTRGGTRGGTHGCAHGCTDCGTHHALQVLHAVLSKQLGPIVATGEAPPPFFFPTGLSKLAAQYGGEELGVAAGDLKTRFSAVFDAEGGRAPGRAPGRPFRQLPLTADAVAYAALDAWNTWLVHEALWPRAVAEGLSAAVVAMSERRACDFRDCADGRALWEVAMAQAKERRREGKGRGQRVKAAEQRTEESRGQPGQPAPSPQSVPREKIAERSKRVRHEKAMKAGPVLCGVCGIQMDGASDMAAHRKGKRHLLAAAVCAKQVPPPLRVEWRPEKESKEANPLGPDDVRQAFAAFGGVRNVAMAQERGANGRWSATVELDSSAAAALAVGCRQLIVREKAVTSEPLGLDSELTEAKGHKKENGARGGKFQEQPPPKKQRVA
jgi:hypothetical protein